MIAILVFYLHIVGAVYAFTKGYVEHKLVDGFMSLAFVGIIFSVGWTLAGFIVRFVFPAEGFGKWFDGDTISLILVTLFEALLYGTYFVRQRQKQVASS